MLEIHTMDCCRNIALYDMFEYEFLSKFFISKQYSFVQILRDRNINTHKSNGREVTIFLQNANATASSKKKKKNKIK
jgi:hypothetical protein